jgi:hypothetical protein
MSGSALALMLVAMVIIWGALAASLIWAVRTHRSRQ